MNQHQRTYRKEIQRLWAELLVIEQSTNPETLLTAWHSLASAKYGFTRGRDKIEVKSSSTEERVHIFSLNQLNPAPNSRLLIASVVVRKSDSATGMSIKGLYDKILDKVSDINSRVHLLTVISEAVGPDKVKYENIYYDYFSAVDSLEFYDYHDIPSISQDAVPQPVTAVRFASNLNGLIDTRNEESTFDMQSSPLFRSLI